MAAPKTNQNIQLPPAPVTPLMEHLRIISETPIPQPVIELYEDDVRELSKALGLNINSSEMLVSRVKAMTALDIDGLEIVLEPALLQRLKSRAVRQGFQPFLAAEITRQLRAFVGM